MDKNTLEKARGFRFDDLLDYSEDSVNSRIIVNKATGTITLFAFDKGQCMPDHTAPFDTMVEIADGQALIRIDQKEYILSRGEAIIAPAMKRHTIKAIERSKLILTMIKS